MVSVVIAFVAYTAYIVGIAQGRIKPHAVSWFLWAVLTALACALQAIKGAGYGALAAGFSSLFCFLIFFLAIWVDRRVNIVIVDRVFAGLCISAMCIWASTRDVNVAAIAFTAADALGYAPTFRKGWKLPQEEMISSFLLNAIKYCFAIMALIANPFEFWFKPISLVMLVIYTRPLATWIYPLSLVVLNTAVACVVFFGQRGWLPRKPEQRSKESSAA